MMWIQTSRYGFKSAVLLLIVGHENLGDRFLVNSITVENAGLRGLCLLEALLVVAAGANDLLVVSGFERNDATDHKGCWKSLGLVLDISGIKLIKVFFAVARLD